MIYYLIFDKGNFFKGVCEDIQYNVNEENIKTSATSSYAIAKNALSGSGTVFYPTADDMNDGTAEWSIELKPNDGSIYIMQTSFEVADVDYISYKFQVPGQSEATTENVNKNICQTVSYFIRIFSVSRAVYWVLDASAIGLEWQQASESYYYIGIDNSHTQIEEF